MANIFLTTTCKVMSHNPGALDNFERIVNLSKQDIKKQHHVGDSPAEADIILFVCDRQVYHSGIYCSDIFKKYSEKSVVIDFNDQTIPRIPGLYATVPLYLQPYPIYEYLFYPYNHGNFNMDKAVSLFSDYKYLFSFIGDVNTCPRLRSQVLDLKHPRAYLQNSRKGTLVNLFSDVLISSKFVLCPRGIAASTIRVFEAMRAGRVPVIISDEWQESYIDGDWKEFSIGIPEQDVRSIPDLLETLEPQALEMGRKAQLAWEQNFSKSHGFHWLIEACLRIQKSLLDYQHISSRKIHLEALNKKHFIPFWKEFIRVKAGLI